MNIWIILGVVAIIVAGVAAAIIGGEMIERRKWRSVDALLKASPGAYMRIVANHEGQIVVGLCVPTDYGEDVRGLGEAPTTREALRRLVLDPATDVAVRQG